MVFDLEQKEKNINVKIGERIKYYREKSGLTQEKLADLLGMGPKNLSSVERGCVGVSITTLIKICKILSISSDQLLFEHTHENQIDFLCSRLQRLNPHDFADINDVISKLIATVIYEDEDTEL